MPDIKTNIKLTGEAEYKKSLSEINAGMKVLQSEMTLVSKKYAENGQSAEALRAKNDVLTRSISSQEEKLATMRAQLVKTAQTYGEGSTKTMQLQAAVNKAEAELVGMKNELKQNEEAMSKTGEKSDSLGTKFQGLTDKLGSKLPAGAQKAIGALKNVDAGMAAAATGAALLVAAVVKVEKAMISMTKDAAAASDELITMSQQMGISAQTLQEYQYAAELVDVSVDTLQGSLTKLTANMAKAAADDEKAAKAFSDLGISIEYSDGSLRNANYVFQDAIDALGKIQNQTERDAAAMAIFGKSAQDLNPLIAAGSDELGRLGAEAWATGYVLDDLSLKKLTKMDDALVELDKTQEAFQKRMSAEFAPYVTDAIERVTKMFQTLGNAVVKSGAAEALGMILKSATDLIMPVDQLSNDKLPRLQTALDGVARLCAAISDAMTVIASAANAFGNLTMLQFGKAGQNLSTMGKALGLTGSNNYQKIVSDQAGRDYNAANGGLTYDSGVYRNGKYYGSLSAYYWEQYMADKDAREQWDFENWKLHMGYNAAGTQRWRGGWSWVGENGPELAYLPAGSQVKSASESRSAGSEIWNITIDAKNVKEFNDVVRLAQTARLRMRKEAAG